jgi:UDP-N-acetylmuramate dehydrogenase
MTSLLRSALQEVRGVVREDVPLRPLTHVRLGGPAAWLVEPLDELDVAAAVRACREMDVPYRVLGGGSNLLVGDGGVPGVVMKLDGLRRIARDGTRLTVGAGVTVPSLLRTAREQGLAGLEVLTGVPAQLGGAVAMNAGTREGETFDRLVSLTVIDAGGELRVLGRDEVAPRYRDGGLGDRICVHATFELEEDDPQAIFARFEEYLRYRNSTQPVTERSVGCVFQNPPGNSAGRLIEQAGCKGWRRGGVEVSHKHANYFVHDGDGTTADFVALVHAVRARVLEESGVALELEVKRWEVPELD